MTTETAQIIQFSAGRPKLGKGTGPRSEPVSADPRNEPATETCKNRRLRNQRHANWRKADALREYWRESMRMMDAVARVQSHNLPEGDLHPEYNPQDRNTAVANYGAAIVIQLLTPASTAADVAWKRAAFKAGDHEYTDIKPERIERAIADDVTFLAAHPVRQSKQQDGAEQPETAEQAALRRMARNATLAAPEPPPSEEELKPPGAA